MSDAQNLIQEDEVLESIIWGNYSLIQKQKGFKFGIDAYLLADFTRLRPHDRVLDLGTGTGIVAMLLNAKKPMLKITALDILPEMTDLLRRTLLLNNITNINIITEDLRKAPQTIGSGLFSLIVANPPYFPLNAGEQSPHNVRAIARSEVFCTLKELVSSAAKLLNYGGRFSFIHRPSRLPEIFNVLRDNALEPKRMRLVYPYLGQEPSLLLIEARKNGGPELRIMPPLFIYSEPGQYSSEIKAFFKAQREER